MAFKDNYFVYSAKKFETGLTDVTATVRRNGVYVLGTGVTPLALTELDNGRYQLILTAAQQVTAGGAGSYQIDVDSASKSAPATATRIITENDNDDIITELAAIDVKVDALDAKVDIIDTNVDQALVDIAEVDAKIDVVDANVDSIKVTVEDTNSEVKDPSHGLTNLKTLIDSIQSTVDNISNVTRFSAPIPSKLLRPDAGTKSYLVPLRLYDIDGNPEAPDANMTVTVKNAAGVDRTAALVNGASGTAHVLPPVSTGVYELQLDIAFDDVDEPLYFSFDYVENSAVISQVATSEIIPESTDSAGLALEATSQLILADSNAILIDTAAMQPQVADIQTQVNSASFGLAALKALIDTVQLGVTANNDELTDGTYGLPAILAAISSGASQASVDAIAVTLAGKASQASVDAAQVDITAIQGAGFVEADHSLESIGNSVYNGGVLA
jgi:hypothetical protein